MKDAISEVLETMFFVMVEFEGDASQEPSYSYQSRIRLLDEAKSPIDIVLRVTEGFARTITANLLGKNEPEVETVDIEDTLKETTNMVSGNYIGRISNSKWRIGIPGLEEPAKDSSTNDIETLFFLFGELVGEVIVTPHISRES
jgi:hypothetical protein